MNLTCSETLNQSLLTPEARLSDEGCSQAVCEREAFRGQCWFFSACCTIIHSVITVEDWGGAGAAADTSRK